MWHDLYFETIMVNILKYTIFVNKKKSNINVLFIFVFVLFTFYFANTNNNLFAENRKIFYIPLKEKDDTNYVLSKTDEKIYYNIKKNIKNKQWFEAYKLEKQINNEGFKNAINILITLNKFKNITDMNQSEVLGLIEFNTEYYFLNEFDLFNSRIETHYINNIVKYEHVKQYFNKFNSKNIKVIVKLIDDQINLINNANQNKEINNLVKNVLLKNNFDKNELMYFLDKYKDILTDEDIISKAEIFVYTKKLGLLESIIPRIKNKSYQAMFENILEIERNPNIISHLIKLTPKELRNNDAFLFSQVRYYRKKDNDEKIIEILDEIKNIPSRESYWWLYKHMYVRQLLKQKKYKKAYNLATSYNGQKNIKYIDAQWIAGWIALRYLDEYDIAYKHFYNIYSIASYPITVAKATYWLGRTSDKMNNSKKAIQWYDKSANYTTTFYGQLSHYAKYNILTKKGEEYKGFELPAQTNITDEDIDNINKNGIVKLALLYYNYEGKREEANNIFKTLISNILTKKGEIAEVIEIVELLKDESMLVPLSKLASYKSVFFIDNLFPLLRMVKKTDTNIALIHAIIKQESGFVIHAESTVGAIGFMQIMPATAKSLCKQMHITYNQYKLKHDTQYNIKLGSYYINQLINQFGGSKILAIASYNAGPNATRKWIKDFGDPRESEDIESVIDWMELITYEETRNYVQRILENLVVYEYKLGINQ